jgi:hypothetical protein
MAYAQKTYNEIQGINGKYRINQIGCFLTSFCNLLERYGRAVDPLTLNKIFRERGIFIDIDDGIRDDLGYQSITAYDGTVVVAQTSAKAGGIPHNNTIVRIKAGNQFGTHFCLVHDMRDGINPLVIDSWDGVVKPASTYGSVTGWATYRDIKPQPVQPIQPVVAAPPADTIVVQASWGISHVAKAAGYPDFATVARWDYLARINGHADHSTFTLRAGQVVRVRGEEPKVAPTPAATAASVTEVTKEAEVIPVKVESKDSFKDKANREEHNVDYVAVKTVKEIPDAGGIHPVMSLIAGQKVHAGEKVKKGDAEYVRTKKSIAEDKWYLIPISALKRARPDRYVGPLKNDDNDIADLLNLDLAEEASELAHNLTGRKRLVAIAGRMQGWFDVIGKRKKAKKEV